jgi:hypothetical protein
MNTLLHAIRPTLAAAPLPALLGASACATLEVDTWLLPETYLIERYENSTRTTQAPRALPAWVS